MNLIKEFDYKNYKVDGTVGRRPSVRAIIVRDNKLAMVYSAKFDYYMFAGGGIVDGEDPKDSLIREIKEELGLEIIAESIKEYGLIVRKEKGRFDDLFIQENYFYLCDAKSDVASQKLDDYEKDEQYELRWVTSKEIIEVNLTHSHDNQENKEFMNNLFEREMWLIKRLISEKIIS